MDNYIYVYFKTIPDGCFLDEIEDTLTDLLGEQGEVSGIGLGNFGGNIDIQIYEELSILQNIKSYLISCGFESDTILDINGKRERLESEVI